MKILQINKYFYKKGGAETVFFNTISMLREKGHTVIPFTLKNKKNLPSEYASYFVDYPELSESSSWVKFQNLSKFIYNKEAARQIEKLIIKEKPDIAHIHLLFNSLSVSILPILKKYKIPTVMTVHDYRLVCPAYTFIDGEGHFCEKCSNKHYYHCIKNKCSKGNIMNSIMLALDSYFRKSYISPIDYIDLFIFVSKFSQNKHIQVEPRFKEKSTYLYNFTPPVQNTSTKKGDYIFFFGRISEEKGILTLVNAIKNTSIRLKIAGTGPLFETLKNEHAPNIEFLGFKQGEELTEYIRNAAFTIVSSECYENNPMSIIESYTIGTPVIASNLGGIPELVGNGETGFLFEPKSSKDLYDKITLGLALPDDKYIQMSEAAKAFAYKNFSAESHFHKLTSIYQQLQDKIQ